MKVCLVTAPTATEFRELDEIHSPSVQSTSFAPQLGILSLAAILDQRGSRPQILDLNRVFLQYINQIRTNEIDFAGFAARSLADQDAEVFGFGSICSTYPLTIRTAGELKALRPDITVVFGGPQASVVDLQTLKVFPFVDFVLRGEAEHTLPKLLSELETDQHLEQVPGLTYRHDSHIVRTTSAQIIDNLDELPFPAYHLTGDLQGAAVAVLELGRGCPFACTFCSTNDFFRRRFRLRSPERVLRDMRAIASAY
jgi:radical SAM superfamily enzyme YgiQ (UPF0313 family)